jgi:hypothetical protein
VPASSHSAGARNVWFIRFVPVMITTSERGRIFVAVVVGRSTLRGDYSNTRGLPLRNDGNPMHAAENLQDVPILKHG